MSAARAARCASPDDVIDAFVNLSAREGFTSDDDAVFVTNIGSGSDNKMCYTLSLAWTDYIHHVLRLALGSGRISPSAWKTCRDALFAAKITPTGADPTIQPDSELTEKIDASIEKMDHAALTLSQIQSELKGLSHSTQDPSMKESLMRIAARLGTSIEVLNISPTTTSLPETTDFDTQYMQNQVVDGFQRYIGLGVGGQSLIDIYGKAVTKIWGFHKGSESGYVVVATKHRKENQCVDAFHMECREYGADLNRKLGKAMSRFQQVERMSGHLASYGEICLHGFIPEARDVVGVDAEGRDKLVVGATPSGRATMSGVKNLSPDTQEDVLKAVAELDESLGL